MAPGSRPISYIDHQNRPSPRVDAAERGHACDDAGAGLPRDAGEAAWLPGGSVARATALGILRGSVESPAWQGVAELAATIEGANLRLVIATTAREIAIHVE